jgi:hypothetical protein
MCSTLEAAGMLGLLFEAASKREAHPYILHDCGRALVALAWCVLTGSPSGGEEAHLG